MLSPALGTLSLELGLCLPGAQHPHGWQDPPTVTQYHPWLRDGPGWDRGICTPQMPGPFSCSEPCKLPSPPPRTSSKAEGAGLGAAGWVATGQRRCRMESGHSHAPQLPGGTESGLQPPDPAASLAGSTQHPLCPKPPVLMQSQQSQGWAGGLRYARRKCHLPDNAFYWTR